MKLYLRTAFKSWDVVVALIAGVAAGLLTTCPDVRREGVTVAIAAGASGVAIMSVVLGAMAIIATLFDGPYRRVLEGARGGFRSALAPYLVVAAVAGAAAIISLLTALGWAAYSPWQQALAMGLSIFLASWCIAGMVSLVGLTIFHAEKRAMLMANIERAATAIRAAQARRSSGE